MKWIWAGVLGLLVLASWSAPYLMRRDLLFGVTVAPEFRDTPAARRMIRRFQFQVFLFALAAVMLGLLGPADEQLVLQWGISPLLLALGGAAAFAQAHRVSRAYSVPQSGVREVDLLARSRSPIESPLALLVSLAILAAGSVVAFSIPDPVGQSPLFAGWSAIVARWTAIDGLVGKPLLFALGASGGSFIPLLFFRFGSRRTPAGITNYRRIMLRDIVMFNAAFSALAVGVMSSGALGYEVNKIEFRIALALIAAGLAAHIAYIRVLRRRENLTLVSVVGHPLGDRTPDESWLWGMFYHNPADPVLFVEARTGPCYTMNFGHLRAWLIVAGFLLLLALPLLLLI
jgi:hypothetical protein